MHRSQQDLQRTTFAEFQKKEKTMQKEIEALTQETITLYDGLKGKEKEVANLSQTVANLTTSLASCTCKDDEEKERKEKEEYAALSKVDLYKWEK
jgi:hypothetical protein